MSNDEKDFPAVSKLFGNFVRVSAEKTSLRGIELARGWGAERHLCAYIECDAFNTTDYATAEAVAAALLEAVAFARAVNRERRLE